MTRKYTVRKCKWHEKFVISSIVEYVACESISTLVRCKDHLVEECIEMTIGRNCIRLI